MRKLRKSMLFALLLAAVVSCGGGGGGEVQAAMLPRLLIWKLI